eukprot:5138168-Prymnesium_polylepis.1
MRLTLECEPGLRREAPRRTPPAEHAQNVRPIVTDRDALDARASVAGQRGSRSRSKPREIACVRSARQRFTEIHHFHLWQP